ncbi:MAG: cell division protein FtsQ/DivIB [Bdellovibrionia bacterium]
MVHFHCKKLMRAGLVGSLILMGLSLRAIFHLSIFTIHAIEVRGIPQGAEVSTAFVSESDLIELSAVPLHEVSLFQIGVVELERRLQSHPWVSQVKVIRGFPHRLILDVRLRKPVAVFSDGGHDLRYMDESGATFGPIPLAQLKPYPVLMGCLKDPEVVAKALLLMKQWEMASIGKRAELTSIDYDRDRGFRATMSYGALKSKMLNTKKQMSPLLPVSGSRYRTLVDFGQEIDGKLLSRLEQLSSVVQYLSDYSLPVRQIWVDGDKKIVVKSVPRS